LIKQPDLPQRVRGLTVFAPESLARMPVRLNAV